ncbi:hypothetical protein [Aneurinibacillus sp. REN35]|uniref:hypothetical protein n=1 Tax=Aneurinibacillus sp. REN35 TaxID=3237286 RepID=UPI0035295576
MPEIILDYKASEPSNQTGGAPAEAFYTVSFSTIDFNAAASSRFIVYQLTGEVLRYG